MVVFLILVAALTLYPLVYIAFGSFKENAELLREGSKLLPEKFVLDNYKQAWQKGNFARYTMNSILISVILIAAGTGQATYIFLVRGYMNTISRELADAAKIDGCTFFQIYYKVILPLLKPILATTGRLSFRAGWNEYIMPLVFTMSNEKMRPLTVGVTMLKNSGDGTAAWNLMFAGATISIIPNVVIYIFTTKQFMNGMTAGAVKG